MAPPSSKSLTSPLYSLAFLPKGHSISGEGQYRALPLLPLDFFRQYWQCASPLFLKLRGIYVQPLLFPYELMPANDADIPNDASGCVFSLQPQPRRPSHAIEHALPCYDCAIRAKRAHLLASEKPCEPTLPATAWDIEKITRRPGKGFGKASPFIEELANPTPSTAWHH
jgi:hypothetical protein